MEYYYFCITFVVLLVISLFSLITLIRNLDLKDQVKIKYLNKLTLILLCVQIVIYVSWYVMDWS